MASACGAEQGSALFAGGGAVCSAVPLCPQRRAGAGGGMHHRRAGVGQLRPGGEINARGNFLRPGPSDVTWPGKPGSLNDKENAEYE